MAADSDMVTIIGLQKLAITLSNGTMNDPAYTRYRLAMIQTLQMTTDRHTDEQTTPKNKIQLV